MIDKIKKNLSVLKEQLEAAKVHIKLDIANGKRFWGQKEYGRAVHSWTFGVVAEVFQHMWRWVFYYTILRETYLFAS